jgi:multidrug efflux pump subunit AcrB
VGILAAMLTTIGALVIVFWLPDFIRHDLKDFSVVVMVNLVIAIVVASVFVPALIEQCGFSSRRKITKRTWRMQLVVAFSRIYRRYVGWSQQRFGRWALLLLFALMFAGSLKCFMMCLSTNTYSPKKPRTMLHIRGEMPVGGSVQELNGKIREVEAFLTQYSKGIRRFDTSVGGQGATIDVDFTDEALKTGFPRILENKVIGKLVSIGGADWATYGVSERGFSNSLQLQYRANSIMIGGYDYDRLYAFAEEMCRELRRNSRVADLVIRIPRYENQEDELYMEYNKRALALSGLHPQGIYHALRNLLERGAADRIEVSDSRLLPVVVRPSTMDSFDEWQLRNSYINVGGRVVRPSGFMGINRREAKNVIPRENQEYILEVAFNVLGSFSYTNKLIKTTTEKFNNYFPVGFRCMDRSWGAYEDEGMQYWLIGLVAVIIFFIIAILYESLMQALAVVLLIPVSFIGLFLTYFVTGVPFGTGGFAAMVLLAGLTVNAGIYIIGQYNNQRERELLTADTDGKKWRWKGSKRYVTAFNHKIIPILLTILSTVLGMIPFLIDGPDDQPFWYALAVGTIGGLLLSIIPLFLFLPCVLKLKR